MIVYQLLRPLEYLRIKPGKRLVDWYLPGAAAGLIACALFYFKGQVNVFGPNGLVESVRSFVETLPGFYIAALAAIATFGRTDIDAVMPGNPPPSIQTVTVTGVSNAIPLTRRRFLCLLFAYLTLECIGLTLAGLFGLAVVPAILPSIPSYVVAGLFFVACFGFFFLFCQMLIITFWGLYYLADRIHQPGG